MAAGAGSLQGLLGTLVLVLGQVAAEESSDAYLRNVVDELKLLNGQALQQEQQQQHRRQAASTEPIYQEPIFGGDASQPARVSHPYDAQAQASEVGPPEARPPPSNGPSRRRRPGRPPDGSPSCPGEDGAALGLAAADLAAMYRTAVERGIPVGQGALLDAMGQQTPRIVAAGGVHRQRLEPVDDGGPLMARPPRPGESQYAYYFYPLKSFQHELSNSHGYRTVPNFQYDSTSAVDIKTEANPMNPVLVGVSSFLGTALIFLLSFFVYPHFMNYMHFPFVTTSRATFENDVISLINFITEGVDYYNRNAKKIYEHRLSIRQRNNFKGNREDKR